MINVPPGSIVMRDWNILIIEYESDVIEKFMGYDINTEEFRFSSAIKEYDPHTNRGTTTTGSRYCFLTPPGRLHPKAQKAYDDFCKVKKVNIKLKYEF